jgi:hypothetical protein
MRQLIKVPNQQPDAIHPPVGPNWPESHAVEALYRPWRAEDTPIYADIRIALFQIDRRHGRQTILFVSP